MGIKKLGLTFVCGRISHFREEDVDVGVLDCGRCRCGSVRHGCQKSVSAPKSDDTGRLPSCQNTLHTKHGRALTSFVLAKNSAETKYAFTSINLCLYPWHQTF